MTAFMTVGRAMRRPRLCYVGGGWYFPGQTLGDLQDEMRGHLEAGCTMLKMKVGGLSLDEDLRRVEAGCLRLPERPGIGFEGQSALFRIMRRLAG